MTEPRRHEPPAPEIATDLVEYFMLVIPGAQALPEVVQGLIDLVATDAIRILDLVVIRVDDRGNPEVMGPDAVDGLNGLLGSAWTGVLLSDHDIELVTLALQPGDLAVVVVAEDRWAEPLAAAARALGGEIRAGERIARARVQAALDRAEPLPEEGADA